MAIFKCKMCGGTLEVQEGKTVCECEYCGSVQTVPQLDDEKKVTLFSRANRLRSACEFDKAAGVYETIVADFPEEAEAYWGLLLCRFGIEYVDDPKTGKKIPTCHRSSFESVMDDPDFELVMENSDTLARGVYREEAKQIEEIRKGIIEVSSTEEPYDIFICYKETDASGERTIDSVIAQDVYEKLTERGYRVFFSRITLEDKLGQEYEPYIFSALNSAKVMLAFGTSYDYYNAVWVKNEWSRYLQLISAGQKKILIPCYKDIDAYDIPKEFKHLQAQDMGKVGAIQDLLRGIDKIFGKASKIKETGDQNAAIHSVNIGSLLKRGMIALEDKEWKKADGFFEEVLNQNAECADAYLGKWLVKIERSDIQGLVSYYEKKYNKPKSEQLEACSADEKHISSIVGQYKVENYLNEDEIRKVYDYDRNYESVSSALKQQKKAVINEINSEKNYIRVKQYASNDLAESLAVAIDRISAVFDKRIKEASDNDEVRIMEITTAYNQFITEADSKAEDLYNMAIERRKDAYHAIINSFEVAKTKEDYETVKKRFEEMHSVDGSEDYIKKCNVEISRLEKEKEKEIERERSEIKQAEAKRRKKNIIVSAIVAVSIVACLVVVFIVNQAKNNNKYNVADEKYNAGDYVGAIEVWQEIESFKDSSERIQEASNRLFNEAENLITQKDYESAISKLNSAIPNIKGRDAAMCHYYIALAYAQSGDYANALSHINESKTWLYDGTDDSDFSKLERLCESAQELSTLDDGNEHELSTLIGNISNGSTLIDTSEILKNKVLDVALSFDGTWKRVMRVDYVGLGSVDYTTQYFEISKGVVNILDENKKQRLDYPLFYYKGSFFIGRPGDKSPSGYYDDQIIDYTGKGDNSFYYHEYLKTKTKSDDKDLVTIYGDSEYQRQ